MIVDTSTESDLCRYEAWLEMLDVMVHHQSATELFRAMVERIGKVVPADAAHLTIEGPNNRVQLLAWNCNEKRSLTLDTLSRAPALGWVLQDQEPFIVTDLGSEARFPLFLNGLREHGLKSYCWLPLVTAERRMAALGLASFRVHAYTEEDMRILPRAAQLIAIAAENGLRQAALVREKESLQTLVEVNNTLVTTCDPEDLFPAISDYIHRLVRHDFVSVGIYDKGSDSLSFYPQDSPLTTALAAAGATDPVQSTPVEGALKERKTKIVDMEDLMEYGCSFVNQMLEKGIKSFCCIPLTTPKGELGALNLASRDARAFSPQEICFLERLAKQMVLALHDARTCAEIEELTSKLASEKVDLEEESSADPNFEEIVGRSAALKKVLSQARTVAASDATVLILGETGTGKELVARAIHRMSLRRDRVLGKLNCAAIPTGLLESELFGHEKGAFTGAVTQKVGRLELADKSSLFLDEVGDISLELQPKLLRVLQDQEFERLGGTRTIKVDIRLIAATNRDLMQIVAEGQFRNDLYYRLNVFPIHMPLLSERKTDIPSLVRHFVHKFARQMNKKIETIPSATMNALVQWGWPGNVRELQNLMERSVILSDGSALNVPMAEITRTQEVTDSVGTLESLERQYIIRVLRETNGVLAGPLGAAIRLGMKRTTLQSRMLRMGISRDKYQ